MKIMMNVTDCIYDTSRFEDGEDALRFASEFGCDGLEVMHCIGGDEEFFAPDTVIGVHLRYFSEWLDLWNGDMESLKEEYGTLEKAREIYGGLDRESLIRYHEEDIARAVKKNPSYVVFHVSNVKTSDVYTYTCSHTDEEVIDAAAELINQLLDGKDYQFEFLMENLWWPGLTITKPEMTKRLLDKVHYPKKGIMLDTGHLMHSNLELKTQEDAIDYILEMVEAHGNLRRYIRGIHLNQSITGDYVKNLVKNHKMPEDYEERFSDCYQHIFNIDCHLPFTTSRVRELVDAVKPEYLTHEMISMDREDHAEKLAKQAKALGAG